MTHVHTPIAPTSADGGHALAKRLDNLGWALFFILTGAVWLVPETQIPPGTWLMGTGILLLSLNAVRAVGHVRVSAFGMLLGVLALAAGLSAFWGIRLPIVAMGLLLLGAGLLVRELVRPQR